MSSIGIGCGHLDTIALELAFYRLFILGLVCSSRGSSSESNSAGHFVILSAPAILRANASWPLLPQTLQMTFRLLVPEHQFFELSGPIAPETRHVTTFHGLANTRLATGGGSTFAMDVTHVVQAIRDSEHGRLTP